MSSLEMTSKFDSLPDDLRLVAAEFIDFLLKKNEARSKKKAVLKVPISIKNAPKKESFAHLFGAWDDERSPEEIIKSIREARFRVEKAIEF